LSAECCEGCCCALRLCIEFECLEDDVPELLLVLPLLLDYGLLSFLECGGVDVALLRAVLELGCACMNWGSLAPSHAVPPSAAAPARLLGSSSCGGRASPACPCISP
jgi:hypothetical protein